MVVISTKSGTAVTKGTDMLVVVSPDEKKKILGESSLDLEAAAKQVISSEEDSEASSTSSSVASAVDRQPGKEFAGMKRRRQEQLEKEENAAMSLRRSRRKVFHADMVYSTTKTQTKTRKSKVPTPAEKKRTKQQEEESHGLLQPGRIRRSEEEKQHIEWKLRGVELYRKYMTGARWVYRKPRTMDTFTGYTFLSPHAAKGANGKRVYSEGTTQFTGYAAIARKCEELGEEKFARLVQHGPARRPGRPRKIQINEDKSPSPEKVPPVEPESSAVDSKTVESSKSETGTVPMETDPIVAPSKETSKAKEADPSQSATNSTTIPANDKAKESMAKVSGRPSTSAAKPTSESPSVKVEERPEPTPTQAQPADATKKLANDRTSKKENAKVESSQALADDAPTEVTATTKSSLVDAKETAASPDDSDAASADDGAKVENWFSDAEEGEASVPPAEETNEDIPDTSAEAPSPAAMDIFSPFGVVSPSSGMDVAALPLELWDDQQYDLPSVAASSLVTFPAAPPPAAPATTSTTMASSATTSVASTVIPKTQLSNHAGGKMAILREKLIKLEVFFLGEKAPNSGILRDRVCRLEEEVGATEGCELLTMTGRISSLGMIQRRIFDLEGPPPNPSETRALTLLEQVEKELLGQVETDSDKSILVRLQNLEAEF